MSGDCPKCAKGFSSSCRLTSCPLFNGAAAIRVITPSEALQRYVKQIDGRVFDEGRLPTIAEWSAVVEMVGKLEDSAAAPAMLALPAPAPVTVQDGSNVVAFRKR